MHSCSPELEHRPTDRPTDRTIYSAVRGKYAKRALCLSIYVATEIGLEMKTELEF